MLDGSLRDGVAASGALQTWNAKSEIVHASKSTLVGVLTAIYRAELVGVDNCVDLVEEVLRERWSRELLRRDLNLTVYLNIDNESVARCIVGQQYSRDNGVLLNSILRRMKR